MPAVLPETARRILDHDRGRDPVRLALKYAKIQASAFAFLRATPFLYFADVPLPPVLAGGPKSWLCGDLHLENFGAYRGSNGLVYFDINDFDEAALAPVGWDLGRLLASMMVAADESTWPRQAWQSAVEACVHTYAETLATGKPLWIERRTARGPIRSLLRQLARRRVRLLLKSRTTGRGDARRLLKDGRRALPATAAERAKVRALMQQLATAGTVPSKVLDVARRIAGTSSLGSERYVVLLQGPGGADAVHLVDLKTEARPASLVAGAVAAPFKTDAARTVELQTIGQAVPPVGLSAQRMGRRWYFMRELQPTEDRMNIERLKDVTELGAFAADLGRLTAWMHLRGAGRYGADGVDTLMAFGRRRDWRKPLVAHARAARDRVHDQHREFAAVDPMLLKPDR